jgi:hypothetical protein
LTDRWRSILPRNPAAFTTFIINRPASVAVCTVVCWHDFETSNVQTLCTFPFIDFFLRWHAPKCDPTRAEVTHSVWVAEYPSHSNNQAHPLLEDTTTLRDILEYFVANMPPSARRAQRARRDTRKEATTSSDAIADSSPTRPAKRRKKVRSPGLNSFLQSMMNPR